MIEKRKGKIANLAGIFPAKAKLMLLYYIPAKKPYKQKTVHILT